MLLKDYDDVTIHLSYLESLCKFHQKNDQNYRKRNIPRVFRLFLFTEFASFPVPSVLTSSQLLLLLLHMKAFRFILRGGSAEDTASDTVPLIPIKLCSSRLVVTSDLESSSSGLVEFPTYQRLSASPLVSSIASRRLSTSKLRSDRMLSRRYRRDYHGTTLRIWQHFKLFRSFSLVVFTTAAPHGSGVSHQPTRQLLGCDDCTIESKGML